jgi:hypothetical protein
MRTIRCLYAATLLAALTFLTPVGATSFTTDQSDLWWNTAESGWGMQLVQRGSVIFATLFVYDQINIPIWYTATLNYSGSGFVWTGDLYLTNGPWLGTVPFNPNAVTFRKVGTMTWNGQFVESGIVNYSVDGVFVTKNVVRQLLVYDDYNGLYFGAVHQANTGCFTPSSNGTGEFFAGLTVVQNGTNISLASDDQQGGICTFAGTLSQGGQFGAVVGNYSCSGGEVGTFNMFEIAVGFNALTARYTLNSTNTGCQSTGYLGGIRNR